MVSTTELLAEFSVSSALPSQVIDRARLQVLDNLSCQFEGAQTAQMSILRGYFIPRFASGAASIIGTPRTSLCADGAALMNGAAATMFESDDYHPAALLHPSSVIVPAVLAVGEELDASMSDCIEAVGIGTEVAVRIAAACQPSMNFGRGIHPTLAIGPLGAAVAVGRLLGNNIDQQVSALGIAGTASGGPLEYSISGGSAKRLNAGLAAESGVRAGQLAARGITGPPTIVEGRRGVIRALSDENDLDSVTRDLGVTFQMLATAYKPYFCNGMLQAPLRLIENLIRTDGLTANDVDDITIGLSAMGVGVCGLLDPRPADLLQAQFHAGFAIGLMLAHGSASSRVFMAAEMDGFSDPVALGIAARVRCMLDATAEERFPDQFFATVRVTTKDGRILEAAGSAPGTVENPLSVAELEMGWESRLEVGNAPLRASELLEALSSSCGVRSVTAALNWHANERKEA
jgi:2-methylcitrate dehydratase PrpD